MNQIFTVLIFVLSLNSFLCFLATLKGPTYFDRLIGANLMVGNITTLIVVMATQYQNIVYLDVALVYAILGFVSVIAISKYLTGREMHK